MEIIDELEPVVRGPYTGCLGYLGFNRESQLNILIRTAVCREGKAWLHVGAGIVADSDPEAEYEETLNKAAGWLAALNAGLGIGLYPASGCPTSRVTGLGTILNTACILIGGWPGCSFFASISAATQRSLRSRSRWCRW